MKFVVGIDGGATRTRLVLAETSGRVVGFGIAGPGNYGTAPLGEVQQNFSAAFAQACDEAHRSNPPIESVFCGLANVTAQRDRQTMQTLVAEAGLDEAREIVVDHDISIALAGGLAGEPGIALIAGTGSSCFGRNAAGQTWQAGGWGHFIDDAGSGYCIAIDGLLAAVRGVDGRGPATILSQRLFAALKIDDPPEIVRRLHFEGPSGIGHPMTKMQIAKLAPLVIKAAEDGDTPASQIVAHAVDELVLMVVTVASKLQFAPDPINIVTTGGVADNPLIAARLAQGIRQRLPEAILATPRFSPVLGAVLLAMRNADIEVTPKILETLTQTAAERQLSCGKPSCEHSTH